MADYAAIEKGAPGQQLMSDLESTQSGSESGSESEIGATTSQSLEPFFRNKNAILVKQMPRGCIQECCGANREYKISSMDFKYFTAPGFLREDAMTQPDELYALEQSSCCMRYLWRDGRAMNMQVSEGEEAGGEPIIEYEKPFGCPLECGQKSITFPCCCLLPELKANVDGHEIKSRSVFDSYCCVSKFAYLEDDTEVYRLKPSTCCGGCLPIPRCQCGKWPSIPYFFYDMNGVRITDGQSDESLQPQIRKVHAGMWRECCTTAETFAIFFPKGIDSKRKAGLLGLTFLTNFERQSGNLA